MEAVSARPRAGEEQAVREALSPLPWWYSRQWIYRILIGAISLAVWFHTVRFQFVWDDQQFIQELQSIRSLKNVPEMFYSLEAQSSFPKGFVLFRPLRTLHYAILCSVGGADEPVAWIYHLANVLWHCAAALLLFSVLGRLFNRNEGVETERAQLVAFFLSIGFAVQPVVSEVVCWAKSLDDIMATVFTLAAMRALLKWERNKEQHGMTARWGQRALPIDGCGWALFYFLLAVYSKESAVPFALVAFILFWQFHKLSFRQSAMRTAVFILVAFVFLVHRHLVIGRSSQTAPISGSYGQTLIDMLPVVPKYLRLLCGVPPFCIDYSYLPGHHALLSAAVLIGAAMLAAVIGLGVWSWRRQEYSLIGFGLLWVGLFLLPVSNVVPMMQYMAERFLYLPLIGWLVALGALLLQIERKRLIGAASSLVVLFWIGLSWQRSYIWKDELTLFVQSSQQGPKTARVDENAVAAIFHLPQIRELFLLDKVTRRLQTRAGIAPQKAGEALKTLTEAQRLFPQDANISSALGITHSTLNQTNEALRCFELATEQTPDNANFWSNLAIAYLNAGRTSNAREAVKKVLALDPANLNGLRSASRLYWQTEDFAGALAVLKKLQDLEPNNQEHAYWIRKVEEKVVQGPRN